MKFIKDFITQAIPQATVYYKGNVIAPSDGDAWQRLEALGDVMVSIDSRTVQPGELFIALKGPNFDGNHYIGDALKKGACGVLMSRDRMDCMKNAPADLQQALFIVVDSTMDALIALAKSWRQRLTCPVVAITGSVGKTSTKEMVRSIVAAAGVHAYVSFKNYNNLFGLCYNILRIPESVAAAVLEVGINEKGEMAQLADIARPSIGVITNVGHAHLEGLGNSLQAVSYEKRQLFAFFTAHNVGIVCGDQPALAAISYNHPIARFGLKTKNQVQARKVTVVHDDADGYHTSFTLKWYGHKAPITLKTSHSAMVNNALAASTVAYFLHIQFNHVVDGLHAYQGFEQRFEMKKIRNNKGLLFNDCYNANPESMKAAIQAFAKLETQGQKIAVLGDMLELGQREDYWHRQIGRFIGKAGTLHSLILVGDRSKNIARTAPRNLPITVVKDWQEATQALEKLLDRPETVVLVKASHGIHLDLMVKALVE